MSDVLSPEVQSLRNDLLGTHREVGRLRAQNAELILANRDLNQQLVDATQSGGRHLRALVAFHQLLDGSDVVDGLRNVSDILVNIIGTEDFAIVGLGRGNTVRLVGGMGAAMDRVRHGDRTYETLAAEAMRVIPLELGGRTVGAIIIDSLLPHRDGFHAADEDILGLLGMHAATAIIAATERRRWANLPLPELA